MMASHVNMLLLVVAMVLLTTNAFAFLKGHEGRRHHVCARFLPMKQQAKDDDMPPNNDQKPKMEEEGTFRISKGAAENAMTEPPTIFRSERTQSLLVHQDEEEEEEEEDIEGQEREQQRQLQLDKRRRKTGSKGPLTQRWYKEKQSFLSPNQKRILREHWSTYGLELKYGVALEEVQGNVKGGKLVLDIGFGLGDSLLHVAKHRPGDFIIGVEIHKAGIAQAMQRMVEENVTNARIIRADVTMLFEGGGHGGGWLEPNSLDEINVFFPDPWPNAERDTQKRVIRESMLLLFEQKLKSTGGVLRFASDVRDYALYVEQLLEARPGWSTNFKSVHLPGQGVPSYRTETMYERKAITLGNLVSDYEFQWRAV